MSFLAIVFAACGSSVYTIWITHKPLPSMLTLCQMKIKEHLLNNSLQNIDRLALPSNLQENLLCFYRSTIKGFLPDPKSLRSFVCHPLKPHLRLQCTMKRIDHETDNPSTMNATNLSGAIYVLYLEYLGGLIPLLTAKRVSKICPDFIIFDPQIKSNHVSFPSSSSKSQSRNRTMSSLKSRSNTFHNMSSIQQSKQSPSNRSSLITNRNSIYVAEHGVNQHGDDTVTHRSSSGCSSDNDSDNDHTDEQEDYDGSNDRRQEKLTRKKPASKVVKHKHV